MLILTLCLLHEQRTLRSLADARGSEDKHDLGSGTHGGGECLVVVVVVVTMRMGFCVGV